ATGEILRGEELISVWKEIFENIENAFRKRLEEIPVEFQKKVRDIKQTTKSRQGKQLPYIEITYKTMGRDFNINVIGPDPNISQVTWLMELVTPPCTSIDEFVSWQRLLNTSLLDSLPGGYFVFPLGLNPLEKEYSSGVTFGEHYHIGTGKEKKETILAMYHVIRNYVPHLIALTANSPFLNKKPTGTVKVTKTPEGLLVLGKDCIKSLRLTCNKAQLGPVDKETYIPCMDTLDKERFCYVIRRKPPDDRFVDIYPFTNYGTIEVRFFDTQFSIARRVAIVALLETLCLKAKRLVEQGTPAPCITSATIINNRDKAATYGLHGRFSPDTQLDQAFNIIYNEDPVTGKQNGLLFHAIKAMLSFLKKEIVDLHVEDYMKPFLLSVSGNKEIKPPVGPADYLLYIFDKHGGDFSKAFTSLRGFQKTYCSLNGDALSDPLVDEWGDPEELIVGKRVARDDASGVPRGAPPEPSSYDFTGIKASVQKDAIEYGKPIPYKLDFSTIASREGSIKIIIIQQLVEDIK
nr:glutamate-cysteine ligase family protein [Candidatus Sigynarchaeota archaeon]